MQLSLQNFSSLIANMAASAQGACASLLDVTVGSVTRALLESSASVALWLQYLILQVLSMTRLATSSGADVDSWVGDFGLVRLPPISAVGSVIMTSLSPAAQAATVPNGALVKTADGSQSFMVTGGPYVRPQGVASVTVAIAAVTAGISGNIQGGSISILGTAIPGIDTVTNSLPLSGGAAAETDLALKARFVTYLNTRSQATRQAVANAISSVQQGVTFIIRENTTAAGITLPGHFTVNVDDGSGSPSASLLMSIYAAIDQIRPIGSTFSVDPPVLLEAVVSISIVTANPALLVQTQSAVSGAISLYINSLSIGQTLRFSRLIGLAYDATTDVVNVLSVTLNGVSTDLGGEAASVVRTQSVTVVVGS